MKKPRITVNCVASKYSAPEERIIEFSGNTPEQGGLIQFRFHGNGKLYVEVYRQGCDVVVHVAKPESRNP